MTSFPSYMQMRARVPRWAWHAIRAASVAAALALVGSLFVAPRVGLFLFWGLFIPLLPLVFLFAPGLWRNVCPLAAVNQAPRLFGFTRGLTLPAPFARYGFLIAVGLLLGLIPARKVLFEDSGPALGLLLVGALLAAFLGGLAFKGKSGWCSSFCPLLPVQRLYGQTPFAIVRNSHCEPCVGCTRNCYDFNPHVAQLADLYDDDPSRGAYRKLFAAAFPGVVLGFYTVESAEGWGILAMYGAFGLYVLGSVGAFFVLESLVALSSGVAVALFGGAALNLYYWFNIPLVSERIADASPAGLVWPARAALLGVTVAWLVRTLRKEERFLEEAEGRRPLRLGATAATALADVASREQVQVTIMPQERRIAVASGSTLLEVVERDGLPIEAGCRMGVCGSDPVCVLEGAGNLSPIGADEQNTLERLGLAENTRMACSARVVGPVAMSLEPERRALASVALAGSADPSVRRVVVLGNGIAGVTAADHVRRRHADCEIDLVGRERHHLYNRMAITRLIYGRSAMQGLYLLPDSWYDEQRIACWLNTQAARIDRDAREVVLATGDVLPYDRLILTAGSRNFVPPIEGFGAPGSFVLRDAEDAMRLRAYVQERGSRRAIVAGGGLLGLETAYALHKLGLHVTVVELHGRLLARQLDERGSRFLERYLEGLGFELVLGARTTAVEADGAVTGVELDSGETLSGGVFLVSAGIVPNVDLARAAGLEVNRGVVVDDGLRTSDPAVLAAGDVAEHRGVVSGLWPAAVEQAKVAAANAVGGDESYEPSPPVTILKVSGVDLTSIGRFEPEAGERVIALEDPIESRYRKLVLAEGRIVGAILLGYAREAQGVAAAVKDEQDVSGELDLLEAGDWSVFVDAPVAADERAAV